MAKVRRYKSSRKYHCPYCNKLDTRQRLISHIDKHHADMLPEGYSAARALYDHLNKKDYGTCLICKKKVYEWDENICRYKNICDNPKCLAELKNRASRNHLEDPEVQKKMLAGRKISGVYTFQDGVTHSYVGSYERNCFEFMDTVLNIPGKDIMSPGPVIYYEYEGQKHPWILDWMYIPAMLCCDVKDGGKNPNNRPMESYRFKQLAKEKAIAEDGRYNYIRLTDNNFGQLMSAIADIRYGIINHDPINHIYINENVTVDADTTMIDIIDLNKRLNGYKYSYKDYKDFAKEYRVAGPEKFEKQEGGVCWDFAAYEAWWFKKNYPNIPFTTWYVIFDNNNDCPTHTFLTFKYKGKTYYIESAFGKTMGVWQVKSDKDAINFVMDKMIGKSKLGEYPYYVIKYDATDSRLIGVGVMTYMSRMSELIEKSTYKHTFSKQYSVEKVDLKMIKEAVGGIPSHRGSGSDYIIPHMLRNTFTGNEIIFGNTAWDSIVSYDYETKTIPIINPKDDKHLAPIAEDYRLILPSNKIPSMSKEDFSKYTEDTLIEYLTGTPYTGIKELLMEKVVGISSDSESPLIRSLILNGIVEGIRTVISEAINGPIFVKSVGYVSIYRDDNGYYAITPEDYLLKSDSYPDIPDHLIDLMNDLYGAHKLREEDAKHAARSRERQ